MTRLPSPACDEYAARAAADQSMETGREPTATSRTLASRATSITDTVPSASLVTKAWRLSWDRARSWLPFPVGMRATTSSVRASITVTPDGSVAPAGPAPS